MRTRSLLTAVVAVVVGAAVMTACAPQVPPDTPGLRLEKARALAELQVGAGGGYEDTLDLGASLAADATVDALVLELGREPTEGESSHVLEVMRSALAEVLTPAQWTDAAAAIYAEHFTPAEMEAALEFYGSPVGARIFALQNVLDDQMGDAIEAIIEAKLESLTARVDAGLAEVFPELGEGAGP